MTTATVTIYCPACKQDIPMTANGFHICPSHSPADLLTPTERENVEGLRHDLRPGHRRGASAADARDLLALLDRIAPPPAGQGGK